MDEQIKKLKKRKKELENSINSYELVYPPPDHKKIADKLVSDIEDLITDIHLENALDDIKDVKYIWMHDGERGYIKRQYRRIYE